MIFRNRNNDFDADIERQDYLELLLEQIFPNFKVNNIVPWQFIHKDNQGFVFNGNNLYFGELFCQSGSQAKLFDVAFDLPIVGSPLRCLFNDLAVLTDNYHFVGWKVSFDFTTVTVYDSAPSTTPPVGGGEGGTPVIVSTPVPQLTEAFTMFYEAASLNFALKLVTSVDGSLYRVGVYLDGLSNRSLDFSIAQVNAGVSAVLPYNPNIIKLAYYKISDASQRSDFVSTYNNASDVKPYFLRHVYPSDLQFFPAGNFTLNSLSIDGNVVESNRVFNGDNSTVHYNAPNHPTATDVAITQNGYLCPFHFTEVLQ